MLKPLMLFAVMYMVFVRFLKFSDGTPSFAISLLCGTCLWSFFNESTSMGMSAIVNCGDLLRKIHFPNYIIVASTTMGAMISWPSTCWSSSCSASSPMRITRGMCFWSH